MDDNIWPTILSRLIFPTSIGKKVIIIAALVSAIGFIDATALNVALSFIQESLNASATDIHWVLEIYSFLAALLMAGGALGDTLGRRRSLRGCEWAICPYLAWVRAVAFCGMADFLRVLTGHPVSLMIPASPALINAGFAPEARGAAIGNGRQLLPLRYPLAL